MNARPTRACGPVRRRLLRQAPAAALLGGLALAGAHAHAGGSRQRGDIIFCANLIYAGTKTSRCFSDRFLQRVSLETNIEADSKFVPVKLASDDVYKHPFAIMTGEGQFSLTDPERVKLHSYLMRGGFLLASAGCSDQNWAASFRREIARVMPQHKLADLPMNHPVFHTVYDIATVKTSHGGRPAKLQGLSIDGRLAAVFSADGLNDTAHTTNCCCCGGDEIVNSEFINANVLAYALLH